MGDKFKMTVQSLNWLFVISAIACLIASCTIRASQPTEDLIATVVAATLTSMFQPLPETPTTEMPISEPSITPLPETATPTLSFTLTSTPTSSETPTQTLTPSPTVAEKDSEIPSGAPTWRDTFESGNQWYLYEDEHVRFEVRDGRVVMTAFKPESWDGFMLTYPELTNFYLEATFTTGDFCEGLDRYGVVFRASKHEDLYTKYYLYGFSCDGRYWLRSFNADRVDNLIPWTPSEWILKGPKQTNRLGVLAQGERLVLFANGKRLGEIKDSTHLTGKFGLFVGALQSEDFQVFVEEIAYWEIP